jgi:hypothetical protein
MVTVEEIGGLLQLVLPGVRCTFLTQSHARVTHSSEDRNHGGRSRAVMYSPSHP